MDRKEERRSPRGKAKRKIEKISQEKTRSLATEMNPMYLTTVLLGPMVARIVDMMMRENLTVPESSSVSLSMKQSVLCKDHPLTALNGKMGVIYAL